MAHAQEENGRSHDPEAYQEGDEEAHDKDLKPLLSSSDLTVKGDADSAREERRELSRGDGFHLPSSPRLVLLLAVMAVAAIAATAGTSWYTAGRQVLETSGWPVIASWEIPLFHTADVQGDYWPSSITTIRQCPASPSKTIALGAGSRWLVPPEPSIRLYAFTIDSSGRRRDTAEHSGDLTGVLQEGVGYGSSEWEEEELLTTPSSQQREGDRAPPKLAGHREAAERVLERLRATLGNESMDSTIDPHLEEVVSYQYDPRFPHFHPTSDRGRLLSETTAPWFELKLNGSRNHQLRLVFFGTELLPSNGSAEAFTTTKVTLTFARDHLEITSNYHLRSDVMTQFLLPHLRCSFVVDVDPNALERSPPSLSSTQAEIDAVLQAVQQYQANVTALHDTNPGILAGAGDAGWDLLCPLPPALSNSPLFLHQGADGPILRLRSLTFRPDSEEMVGIFFFRAVSLPLCTIRTRKSMAGVMLGQPSSGPPGWMTPDSVHQWVQWQLFIGVEQLYILDRYGSLYRTLLPYMQRGLCDYMRWPFILPSEGSPYEDQIAVDSFLLQLTRLAVQWVLQVDADEYLIPAHPYYTDSDRFTSGPHPDCLSPQRAGDGPLSPLRPPGCDSILSSLLGVANESNIRDFTLFAVPMHGLSANRSQQFETAYYDVQERLQSHYAGLLDRTLLPSERVSLGDAGVIKLVNRLVWRRMSASSQAELDSHGGVSESVMDIFPKRLVGMDRSRPKSLYRPRYVTHIDEHIVVYAALPHIPQSDLGLSMLEDADSFFSNLGGNAWRKTMVEAAEVTHNNPHLDLDALLCQQSPVEAFAQPCCAAPTSTGDKAVCLANAVRDGKQQWAVALRSPYFPLSAHPSAPAGTLLPASLALRVYHYICVFSPPQHYKHCNLDRLWRRQVHTTSVWEPKLNLTEAESWENEADNASARLREAWQKWRQREVWLHRV